MQRYRLLIFLMLTVAAAAFIASCDLIEGDPTPNAAPEVWFINVPIDSTTFSYAPEVHWTGYDPDGFVSGYEYHDDASDAAIEAYRAGDAALNSYIASLPASAWIQTASASQIIYLLTEEGQTQEHVFMVRCKDDQGLYSPVRVRTFFRTNLAPNPPEVRWGLADLRQGGDDYDTLFVVEDTLFWDDTLSATWPGIEFIWQGTDPDSRLTNIIPLEFSYCLVNQNGDTMRLPIYDDSLNFAGYQEHGTWTDWTDATQTILYGYETGNYTFYLRVRDDGLTESSTIAKAEFYAIKPERSKFLLIVDSNNSLSPIDRVLMGRDPDSIMAFYETVVPEAWELANQLRTNPTVLAQSPNQEPLPPFGDFLDEADYYTNRTDQPLPYALLHKYEVVWMIDDDNAPISGGDASQARMQVLQDFMDVGGHMLLTGRRVFNGPFGVNPGDPVPSFFTDYFDLTSVQAKSRITISGASAAEFGGASGGNSGLLSMSLNESVMDSLKLGPSTLECLPEVEWFGRSTSRTGLDFSVTIFNYVSCTADDTARLYNQDLEVLGSSTPTVAILSPPADQNKILDVLRVYNVTKGVFGDYMYTDANATGGVPNPRIYVSTPAEAGTWVDDDVLEVDFIYDPVSNDHDQPIGERFARMDGIIEIDVNPDGSVETFIVANNRFKTSLYTFPLSFMDNTPRQVSWAPEVGDVGPVTLLVALEILWFKIPVDFVFSQGF